MDPWVVWVVIAVVLIVAEATTTAFVAIYFGVGALAAAGLALLGAGVALQLVAFGALAVGALLLTRPALLRSMARSSGLKTGVDAMQGKIGVVTMPIAELDPGQIKVGGEMWTARSFYDGESIPAGTRIEVVKVEGVTALVISAPSPHEKHEPKEEPDA